MGCRPRLYVNLLADYRDDSGGYSHDGIPRHKECRVAGCVVRACNPDRGARYLVLFAGINKNSGAAGRLISLSRCIHMTRRALEPENQ